MAVSGKHTLQKTRWVRSLNPVLGFGLTCMLAACVLQRGTPQGKAPEPITPDHLAAVSPSPAPLPLPPLEALYARYPSHLLGIGEGCHVDASKRHLAAEQAARYHLARTIHVTITSEVTWLRTSRLTTSEGKESFQEVFCKTYREAVDEWLGATDFEPLMAYTNPQGTPCIQLLTVISLAELLLSPHWAVSGFFNLPLVESRVLQSDGSVTYEAADPVLALRGRWTPCYGPS